MDSFVEKFNIFDFFTMLIPGMIITTLFGISLSFKDYNLWLCFGDEKYVIFFIFSYLCGLFFHELGDIADKKFLYNFLYGGNPREIYLMDDKHKKIFNNELSYIDALKVRDYFINSFDINTNEGTKEADLNSLVFSYCLNMSEMKKITNKSDKMIVISEMSRTIFWGCIFTLILNSYIFLKYSVDCKFFCIENIMLFFLGALFLHRKIHYEKYRIRILFRTFLIYLKQNNLFYELTDKR